MASQTLVASTLWQRRALTFGIALVVLANSFSWIVTAAGINRQAIYTPWAIVLLAASLIWARRSVGLTWDDVGLGSHWRHSAIVGVIAGLASASVIVLYFLFPFGLSGPVHYRDIENLSASGLAWRLGFELIVAVALTEEVLFRGILQTLFIRSHTPTRALVLTNVFFALWHLVVAANTIHQNTPVLVGALGGVGPAAGYFASIAGVGLGGLFLSVLRDRTGHLAGSIIVHWLFDAAMTISVYI